MSLPAIKACPFCQVLGSSGPTGLGPNSFFCGCGTENCPDEQGCYDFATEEAAINHWNDRRWLPMSDAPKDGTRILAQLRSDLVAWTGSDRHKPWEGCYLVVRHRGLATDGFDIGWQAAAPVGHGGWTDEWFVGWRPVE